MTNPGQNGPDHLGPADLKYDHNGLIPAVIQDVNTGAVLMVAYMNRESLQRTMESGQTWFWSRSRREYWLKGATSGNIQEVKAIYGDCDADTLLIKVVPKGPGVACHTGRYSCFHRPLAGRQPEEQPGNGEGSARDILYRLEEVIRERRAGQPAGSYVSGLLEAGVETAARKVGEEALETALAAVAKNREALTNEAADLLFHLLVLLEAADVPLEGVMQELLRRRRDK